MRKSTLTLVLVSLAILGFAGGFVWADEKVEPKDVKKLSGKELYRNYCKICHESESPNGEYTPMSLIQEQWERFFTEKYIETHKELTDSTRENQKVIEIITPEMLEKITEFCIEGAADSEHPMTCG